MSACRCCGTFPCRITLAIRRARKLNGQKGKGRSSPPPKLDRSHQVPYLAGYSVDDRVVYIDERLPAELAGVEVAKYLTVHEEVEKDLIDKFGFDYLTAHECATAAEHEHLRQDGHDVAKYEAALKPYIEQYQKTFDAARVPRDLDLTPYEDSGDERILRRIKSTRTRR